MITISEIAVVTIIILVGLSFIIFGKTVQDIDKQWKYIYFTGVIITIIGAVLSIIINL